MSNTGNLEIYNRARTVPDTAKKEIKAGKLKGFTDINPMWRIKALTELFGPCGIGWKPVITRQWLESYESTVCAFCDIELYVKHDGEWSEAIPGTGGSKFVSQTRNGADISDECFKMAFTDAISVAAKMLGVAADVYWNDDSKKEDQTKYSADTERAGTDILIESDRKKFSQYLRSVYGRSEARANLLRLTGHNTTSDLTYDEYWFALKKINREIEMADEPDTVGEVEIETLKKVVSALGGDPVSDMERIAGIRVEDISSLTKSRWGEIMVILNGKLDEQEKQRKKQNDA